jgi:FkbM family methyltransferase
MLTRIGGFVARSPLVPGLLKRLARWASEVARPESAYRGLDGLDRRLQEYVDYRGGFFIEAGANDGLQQSNTYWLERLRGWRGLLVEAVPELARACRRNRPGSIVYDVALVADGSVTEITMKTAGLMSIVSGALGSETEDAAHVAKGIAVQGGAAAVQPREIRVRARTLTSILEEVRPERIDLLSLDVEGYETEVLWGLDLARFRPRYILVESRSVEATDAVLCGCYERIAQLSHHDYLYVDRTLQRPKGTSRRT